MNFDRYHVRCTDRGEVRRLLRREGLYGFHLANWRKARREGALSGLRPKKRGRKPVEANPLTPKVMGLEAKVKRLEKELAAAHTILDVQGRVAGFRTDERAGRSTCRPEGRRTQWAELASTVKGRPVQGV